MNRAVGSDGICFGKALFTVCREEAARLRYMGASLVQKACRLYGRRDAYGAVITVIDGVNERMWGAWVGEPDLQAVGTRPLGASDFVITTLAHHPFSITTSISSSGTRPTYLFPSQHSIVSALALLAEIVVDLESARHTRQSRKTAAYSEKSKVRQRAQIKLQTETHVSRPCSVHAESIDTCV